MNLTDPIGDMIARIRNGQMRSLDNIQMPGSKLRENILNFKKNLVLKITVQIGKI